MPSSRSVPVYTNSGHPFDRMLSDMVGQIINGGEAGSIQQYFNHFITWEGPVGDAAAPGTGGWICTSVDGGGDAGEVVDVRDSARYGILRILTNDADNDNTQIQINGSAWRYSVGQRMVFAIKFALEDADDGECFFGLSIESDTDAINTLPTDGIFFEKAEAATDLDFHTRKNGTSTERTADLSLTLADDTMQIVGFTVDESGNVQSFAISSTGTVTRGTAVAGDGATTIPDDEDLTLVMQIQTGAAATRYMDIDWVAVAAEHA